MGRTTAMELANQPTSAAFGHIQGKNNT